jgi:hypothetical protein
LTCFGTEQFRQRNIEGVRQLDQIFKRRVPQRPVDPRMERGVIDIGVNGYTDDLNSYRGMSEFEHGVVDHAVKYVDGKIHTNRLENFWSLLKRGINGTYVSVEPFHLFRYLDEQMYRHNNRKDENGEPLTDFNRFKQACSQIVGKRLTWNDLTGKTPELPTCLNC